MSLFIQFTDFILYPITFKGKKKGKEVKDSLPTFHLNVDLGKLLDGFKSSIKIKPSQTQIPFQNLNLCDNTIKYLNFLVSFGECFVSKTLLNIYYLNIEFNHKYKWIKIEENKLFTKTSEKGKWVNVKPSSILPPKMFSGREIENFVHSFNNLISLSNIGDDRIELVSGEKIGYWYKEKNYHSSNFSKDQNGITTLGKSCMRTNYQYSPKLYELNPEKVNMLVIYDKNNRLKGRAIVWLLDNGKFFMDRCYYMNESIERLMYMVGILNGWLVKMHYINQIWDGKRLVDRLSLKTTIVDFNLNKNPYFDTFHSRKKNKKEIILTN